MQAVDMMRFLCLSVIGIVWLSNEGASGGPVGPRLLHGTSADEALGSDEVKTFSLEQVGSHIQLTYSYSFALS